MAKIIEVNKESRRVTLAEEVSKACITLTVHRDDKEGIEFVNSLKVGENVDIQVECGSVYEEDELLKTNEELRSQIDTLRADMALLHQTKKEIAQKPESKEGEPKADTNLQPKSETIKVGTVDEPKPNP